MKKPVKKCEPVIVCQGCVWHSNKPSKCGLRGEYVNRKKPACIAFA